MFETARGLLYRSPGDIFKNPAGQEIAFSRVIYYPGMPGAYQTPEEFESAISQIEQQYPNIVWVNNRNSGTLAAAVLEFDVISDGQPTGKMYFGRFFKQINSDMAKTWKNNGLPGDWQLQKASSLKSSFKLKPADIFESNAQFETPLDLINAMSKSPNGYKWAAETAVMLSNKLPVYKDAKDKQTAIRDDLGEVLAPIALVQNMIKSPGLEQAKNDLNDGQDWSGTISFMKDKNAGLKDSEVILPNGTALGISSKGKGGATASIKNAYDGIALLREQSSGTDEKAKAAERLLNKYESAIVILEILATSSQLDGPLKLAEYFGVLGENESNLIRQLIKENHKDFTTVAAPQDIKDMLSEFTTVLSANRSNPKYNLGYHILAGVARDMADMVNSDKTINFSEACLKFINSTPLIQIYTYTEVQGNDVKVTRFDALYPPNFKGNIVLDASKVYYASDINGRYTFAFSPTTASAASSKNSNDSAQDQSAPIDTEIKPPSARAKADKMKEKEGPRTKRK